MRINRNLLSTVLALGLSTGAWAQTSGTQGSTSGSTQSQPGQTQSGTQTDRQAGSQSSQQSSQQSGHSGQHSGQAGTQGHTAGAAGSGSAESMIGRVDQQFIEKAAQNGMMEVHLAELAQQKADSQEVKDYAQQLKQDHEKANDQLKQIAQQRGVSLPSDMGKHQQQVSKLNNLSGAEFDRAFMKMQVQHHKKDIKEFQRHSNRSMDTSVKDFASAQVPVLQQHLQRAEQIAASTGTRARKADKNTSMNQGSANQDNSSTGANTSGSTDSTKTGDPGKSKAKGQDNPTTQK